MNGLERGISRRRFLHGISGTVGGLGLAACEYRPAPSEPPPEVRATVAPAPTRKPYLMPVEVELMIASISEQNSQAFQESLRVFHSYYPGIRISLEFPSGGASYWEWIAIIFVAGNGIDVAQIPGSHLAFTEYNFVRKLDEFVKADSSFDIEPYYTRIVDYYNTPDDGLWCLPWSYTTEALYYNKQHFAEAGISTPSFDWTWEDVREAARKLTKDTDNDNEPERWGVEFRLDNLDYVLRSFGGGFPIGEPENPDEIRAGNVVALQFVADLVLEDRVHPYSSLGWDDDFALGEVSMAFLPEWETARLNSVEGLVYDVAPIPQGPAGSVTSFAADGVAMGGYYCDHPDHSWEVVKWFAHADYGEWDVARALLIPEGRQTALIAPNAYCWTAYHEKPENRHLFLQNIESAMVPFSNSPWWPYLSEGWFGDRFIWRNVERVLRLRATAEEVTRDLEEGWETERMRMAEILSKDYSKMGCGFQFRRGKSH